jgi:hypothetical protein
MLSRSLVACDYLVIVARLCNFGVLFVTGLHLALFMNFVCHGYR